MSTFSPTLKLLSPELSCTSVEAYSEPCERSKMERFLKIVNYFGKTHHGRCLAGF